MKYQVWATSDYGNGHVQNLGMIEDLTELTINIGMFSADVVITIEEYIEEKREKDE